MYLTAMISNYGTSYNAVNVGIALPVLNYTRGRGGGGGGEPYSSPSTYESTSIFDQRHDHYSTEGRRGLDGGSGGGGIDNEDEQDSLVASSLVAGMIVGQLIGGFLGDVLGRRTAMMLVMTLQICGSLGSALFVSTGSDDDEDEGGGGGGGGGLTSLEQLAIWRFILGIGAGGVYPLAAVMSAENKEADDMHDREEVDEYATISMDEGGLLTNDGATFVREERHERHERHDHRGRDGAYDPPASMTDNDDPIGYDTTVGSFQRIALTFSTQGLGFVSVPLLAYPMLELGFDTDVIWRLLFGIGALPGLLVLYLRLRAGNTRGLSGRNGETEMVVACRDEPAAGDIRSTYNASSMIRAESLELTTSNQRNEDETNLEPSTLFCDTSCSESNEMALVENSHLEDDSKRLDQRLGINDDGSTIPIRVRPRGLWESIKAEPNLGRKVAGTAVFYGNTLFEPFVLEAAFGTHSTNSDGYELLQTAVRDTLVISFLSLPGYFITVSVIGRRTCMCLCRSIRSSFPATRFGLASCTPCDQSPAFIQMQGFLLMTILYSIIGLFWTSLSSNQSLLLILYSGTFLFANYGPNTTTFILPSVTYSEECRSTLNGICAAAGKVGALVGASVFTPAADLWGVNIVMICCACVSLVAWALTKLCLSR
ncbi:hypothetical protein ACHAXA_010471 [Cyclostephanos tholiformis]|uniref:Major facilitator superfamily (MFS) profile domain-containing protein n=1 Tax=Cyclostephanos tholiformis TaxID=382380 RepID=A0ABD3SFW9_9STRA